MITSALLLALVTTNVAASPVEGKVTLPMRKRQASPGTAAISNWGRDQHWTVPVSIGTPAQEIDLVLDTAVSKILVYGQCPDGNNCADNLKLFNSGDSSTFQGSQTAFNNSLGGLVGGNVATDTVSLAGYTKENQEINVVDKYVSSAGGNWSAYPYAGSDASGVLGLAFPRVGSGDGEAFIADMDVEVGFYLRRDTKTLAKGNETKSEVEGGEMTIGGVDSSKIDGEMNYVQIVSKSTLRTWAIPIDGITANGKEVSLKTATGWSDSGNRTAETAVLTLVTDLARDEAIAPYDDVKQMYDAIGAIAAKEPNHEKYFYVACDNEPNFEVSFKFNDVSYPIYAPDLLFARQTADELKALDRLPDNADADVKNWCQGAVLGSKSLMWVLGDLIMTNAYTSLHYGTAQVGFGKLKTEDNVEIDASNFDGPAAPNPSSATTSGATPSGTGTSAALPRALASTAAVVAGVVIALTL